MVALLLLSTPTLAQEEAYPDLLISDDWGKEIFTFPIRFAKKIPFDGFEEARFPKGWGDKSSPYFWTYAFVWKIDVDSLLSSTELEVNLQYYFDGLLGLDFHEDKPKTNAVFVKNEGSANSSKLKGKIKTLDTRFTQKPMTLKVLIDQRYCEESKKLIVLFKFSPKASENEVWIKLNEITFSPDVCK